jgi:hypothetical protein
VRFIAGFLHEKLSAEEHRQLLARIEDLVGREVDVAAACGLARRKTTQEAFEKMGEAATLIKTRGLRSVTSAGPLVVDVDVSDSDTCIVSGGGGGRALFGRRRKECIVGLGGDRPKWVPTTLQTACFLCPGSRARDPR